MIENDHQIYENSDVDDVDNVYEASAPVHRALSRAVTEYRAWHHPRKQWVRLNQWCDAIQALLRDLSLGVNASFNYLTLPGNELLDIRAIHGVFERAKRKLRYLGFNAIGGNAEWQTELNLSRNEVSALPWIDPFSHVEEDRLETIVRQKSPGYGRVADVGHFHAINLDLCDSLVHRDVGDPNGSVLGALRELIRLQMQSTSPWLLFITTKIEPGLIPDRIREGFDEAIADNIDKSEDFARQFCNVVGLVNGREPQARERAWGVSGDVLVRLFATGLGKWLLALLCKPESLRSFRLLNACIYKSGHTTNMLSIAFRCDTPAVEVRDEHGIFEGENAAAVDANEIELGVELARAMGNCFDLDVLLAGNSEMADKLIEKAARLMSSARYDAAAYIEWARRQVQPVA